MAGPAGVVREASRRRLLEFVELVYACLSVAAGVALLFSIGPVAHAANQTSEHILGAALLAFGIGAVAVARDPVRNRALLQVEIVFTALCTLSLVWRLLADGPRERTWLLLAPLVVGTALLVWLYPASGPEQKGKG